MQHQVEGDRVTPLSEWESFYVIVGSSAGGLTGLQFVVMTLIAQSPTRNRGESVSAFGTPNVVHFCAALLVSAILSIPWSILRPAGVGVACAGGLGVIYSAIVLKRALRQNVYEPVFEDWLWHCALPAVSYGTMLVAGLLLRQNHSAPLFFIGPAVLMLVFVGIHNAWDTVTYITAKPASRQGTSGGGLAPERDAE